MKPFEIKKRLVYRALDSVSIERLAEQLPHLNLGIRTPPPPAAAAWKLMGGPVGWTGPRIPIRE